MNIWMISIARAGGVELPPGARLLPERTQREPGARMRELLAGRLQRFFSRGLGAPRTPAPAPQPVVAAGPSRA